MNGQRIRRAMCGLGLLALVSCSGPAATEPAMMAAATATMTTPATEAAAPTPTAVAPETTAVAIETAATEVAMTPDGDAAAGAALWTQLPCSGCHGPNAEGQIGPPLAGTGLSISAVLARVRLGKGVMPAFSMDQVSDREVEQMYAWLQTLEAPAGAAATITMLAQTPGPEALATDTPAPTAAPTDTATDGAITVPEPVVTTASAPAAPGYPTQALVDVWFYVNEMRIRADFAKDLPARTAQDDAGRLKVVQDYCGDGLNQAAIVQQRANQALGEVTDAGVQTILREIMAETDQVTAHFNQALAENSYAAAWNQAAAAVSICRIDTLPWATQAVRDAGLVGTVRVRVTDPGGAPLAGALATVLTAHDPFGGRTDANGWVTFANVAAVPALQVKAYAAGRVYHEMNVNLAAGQTVEGAIALPPLSGPGLAPSASEASISPTTGGGGAALTLALTATDPQGTADLAEDQIFALCPQLGRAYVLLSAGGDRYQRQLALPGLPAGQYTWYLFAVDHECNTSGILPVSYQVQP